MDHEPLIEGADVELVRNGDAAAHSRQTYGRGGFLGLLSPLLAFFLASRGMNGWQQSAIRDMEDDAVVMAKRGYRIVSTQEFAIPLFGIASYKVTYELASEAADLHE